MNRRRITYGLMILGLILGLACCVPKKDASGTSNVSSKEALDNKKENLPVTEFVKWCADEKHELIKTKEISDIRYQLTYMPMESMAYLELRKKQYDYPQFRQTCTHYKDMTYFNFKIEVINGNGELLKYQLQSPQQYDWRVKYTSFDMQNDIYIVQAGDTLRPGLYQFERIFEVAPYSIITMAFDNKKYNKEKEFTLVYNDKLFGKGFIKFNYKNDQLINVPNITGL